MDESHWSVVLGHGIGDIELGTPYQAIVQKLEDAKLEFEVDEDDPSHLYVTETELQLTFSGDAPPVLVQVAANDERVHFGGRPVINRRLHEIITLLQVKADESIWRLDDDPVESLGATEHLQSVTASDRELLLRGTLWIRPLGLGLHLWRGVISEVYLRQPVRTPSIGVGQLTPLQVELSQRQELPNELDAPQQAAARLRRWFRLVTGVIFFSLMGIVVFQAAKYQRRWQEAPKTEAEVIVARPEGEETIATEYVVSYRDQNGVEHQANLGLADLYVPKAVGDKVEVHYLPEEPDKPLGPGRWHDAAFVKFFPYGIAVLAGYLVLQIAGAIVVKLATTKPALT